MRPGRAARQALERAREAVAALVGASPRRLVFTSGGTEANNQALASVAGANVASDCLVSAIEHDSVLAARPDAPRLPVDEHGVVDLPELAAHLARTKPALVSVMAANNETGVIQPLREVVALARQHGALVHVDAVQAAGKIPLDLGDCGDLLSLSAHKFGGPQGVGALVFAEGVEPSALLQGGGQEQRWRPGTENLPGIVGFGRAAELAMADHDWASRVGALRDTLETRIRDVAPEARIFGDQADRLANTSCLTMHGVGNQTQLIAFDLAGIAVSTGSACSSGKVGPSHVLAAMGVTPDEAATAIRVSLGWDSSAVDVDRFVTAWTELYRRSARSNDAAGAAVSVG